MFPITAKLLHLEPELEHPYLNLHCMKSGFFRCTKTSSSMVCNFFRGSEIYSLPYNIRSIITLLYKYFQRILCVRNVYGVKELWATFCAKHSRASLCKRYVFKSETMMPLQRVYYYGGQTLFACLLVWDWEGICGVLINQIILDLVTEWRAYLAHLKWETCRIELMDDPCWLLPLPKHCILSRTMADHGRLQVYVILYQRNHLFANKTLHGCNIKPIFVAIGSQMLRPAFPGPTGSS